MMLWAIGALIFTAVVIAAWGLLRKQGDVMGRRLGVSPGPGTQRQPELSLARRVLVPFGRRVGNLMARFLPQDALRRLEHMLVLAGQPMPMPLYLAFWGGLVLFLALFGLYLGLTREGGLSPQILVVGIFLLSGIGVSPYLILARRVRERQVRITKALPNALDLLVTCMEAGLGMDAAIGRVREKSSGPLAEMFSVYLRQVGMGRSRRDAMVHVAEISGVAELVRLARAMVQADAVGASMGDVLRTHAADLRLARRQKAQQAAQRAPVLMTIPLVLCFMPAMAAVVVVPAILHMLDFFKNMTGG